MTPEQENNDDSKHTFSFAKFARSLRSRSEQQVPVSDPIQLLSEGGPLSYYAADIHQSARNEQRMYEINEKLPTDIRDNPQAMYDLFQIPAMQADLNQELTDSFRKEDEYEMPKETFRVVTDPDHNNWLIKSFKDRRWEGENVKYPIYHRLNSLRGLQGEESAYLAAKVVDYPVPETKFVQYDGKPWIAYDYIETARDHSSFDPAITRKGESIQITSVKDVLARPLFNALICAGGDSADQGIVDTTTGQYYAQDLRGNLRIEDQNLTIEEIAVQIARDFNEGTISYGPIDRGLEEEQEAYEEFIAKLGSVTIDTARPVYRGYIGTANEKEILAQMLVKRARALEFLWQKGFFKPVR